MEDFFYKSLFFIFKSFNKPMVHYFSLMQITDTLGELGFKNISLFYLDTGKAKLCPFDASMGVPFKYTPLTHVLVEAIK
jgi:hypothetical protein